jgi:uncharacterized protein (TIGR03435 family)
LPEATLAFDVASVTQNKLDDSPTMNFSLGPSASYTPSGGYFAATNIPLYQYIAFAYKMTNFQLLSLLPQLPTWVATERFDIHARAEGNPTKDQMRLMMRTLLADRFKMTIHQEIRQVPVFGLILDKPGKIGPQLRPHPPEEVSCSSIPPPTPPTGTAPAPASTTAGGFPVTCGGVMGMPANTPGHIRFGARNVTMPTIAAGLTGPASNVDRPVVDQTGLTGTYDFVIEFLPEPPQGSPPNPDKTGPTFLEALTEQLGLKLTRQKGPAEYFIVDHIEKPLAN